MADSARLHLVPDPSEPREPRHRVAQSQEPRLQEPLWREVLGRRLRVIRQDQRETLAETAGRAGISPQYLSEVERGRKEPSSEMIAALAGALGITLIDLTEQVAGDLRRLQAVSIPRRAGIGQPRAQLSLAA
ncbi:MAG TPA: helix-turn-helix transcriptional regulator [Streptosporangiaceae bacterium]